VTLAPGDTVHVRMTKWGDLPHWEFDAVWLGSDQHGDWLGFLDGTVMTRPGAEYVAPYDQVGLVPAVGLPDAERGWLATFHSPGGHVSVYVDVTAPVTWSGPVVNAIDLDLDVVRLSDGEVFVDDEDEFAEHQVTLGYPAEVIAAARASCDRVHALVDGGRAPYDGSHAVWLERLADVSRPQ
jgi:uncharacterized protein